MERKLNLKNALMRPGMGQQKLSVSAEIGSQTPIF
jgi:hypothetical protein